MSVISYTLAKCTKCLKCLRVCPNEAISIQNQRVVINNAKCMNCGKCMNACYNQGLQAKGSTLYDLQNYEYKIALVPSAIYSDCSSNEDVETLLSAIERLGFDEVIDMSPYEGDIYQASLQYIQQNKNNCLISSFCPVVNKLIELKFPMLLSSLIPFDYAAEIAARDIRKKHEDKKELGIFYLCECVSKLAMAKYPYGNQHSSIDHALSIVDVFPMINHLRDDTRKVINLCPEGLKSTVVHYAQEEQKQKKVLAADGLEKVISVLELAEFGLLKDVDFLSLSACTNGCVGGQNLWGNPFVGQINIDQLLATASAPVCHLRMDQLYGEPTIDQLADMKSMQLKLALFARINEQMDALPGFDCGACGFSSCRTMAEEIAEGRREIKDCRILNEVKT